MLLYFAEDERVKKLVDQIRRGSSIGLTCETNLAELYYKTCEKIGRETARTRDLSVRRSGISILAPNEKLSQLAGDLKYRHRGSLSLVDAYVVAAAMLEKATLLTSDSRIAELKLVAGRLLRVP